MKKQILAIAAACLALLAVSCKQDVPVDTLTVSSEKTINAKWQGATADIVFTTNADWEIICAPNYGDAFLSVEEKEGEAGAVTVKLTISENPKYEARLGTVVILAGSLEEKITVNQDARGTTSEDKTETFNFLAHEFTLSVSERPASVTLQGDAQGWVTAEPDFGKVDFTITENSGAKRTGHVDILVGKHTIHLAIEQEAESGELKNASAVYYGHKFFIYDKTVWSYTTFKQYQLSFESEYGEIVLVINGGPEADPEAVPTGTFLIDADATFKPNTFTVAGNPVVTYYTLNGEEITVVDGQIDIAKSGSDYEVTATLLSDQNVTKTYTYKGAIAAPEYDALGGQIDEAPTYTNLNTYYAGNATEWSYTLYFSEPLDKDQEHAVNCIYLKVYTEPGSSADPEGTFTFDVPGNDATITYPNGKLAAKPGTFNITGVYSSDSNYAGTVNSAKTLTITKVGKGKVQFDIDANITMRLHKSGENGWIQDENNNYVWEKESTFDWTPSVVFSGVKPGAAQAMQANPDAETVTLAYVNPTQYVGYWYSDIYGEGLNTFAFGFNGKINDWYTAFLTVVSGEPYVYEKNYANRFCNTPIPDGVYEFSNEAGPLKVVPTARCYVQNSYTGTQYKINGGSLTIKDGKISYNLTGKAADGSVCKFEGGHDATCMYLQDYSNHETRKLAITPVE